MPPVSVEDAQPVTDPPSGQFPEVSVQRDQTVLAAAANSRERRAATVIGHHPAYPFTGPDLSDDLRVYAHNGDCAASHMPNWTICTHSQVPDSWITVRTESAIGGVSTGWSGMASWR
jgi:hypothetical protein